MKATICSDTLVGELNSKDDLKVEISGKYGVDNYEDLDNLPSINGVTLEKDKTSSDLKLQSEMKALTNEEIANIFKMEVKRL